MQNLLFYNTETRTDYTRGGIRERADRPPVESPVSKSAQLVEIFQTVLRFIPLPNTFPLFVKDWRIASRVKEILGLPQDKTWGQGPYRVNGLEVHKWFDRFEKIIGRDFIDAAYIVGSAAVYIAGQPLLREALDIFFRHIPDSHPEKVKLYFKLIGKIAKKTFSFADVDIRIKVKPAVDLAQLQVLINSINGCKTLFINNQVFIFSIEDENGKALDVTVYHELDAESAFNLDDFKINIYESRLDDNLVRFNSIEPWKLWFGHTLGILEDNTTDKFRTLPRLLWQLSKSKISILPTESSIFPRWINKINFKLKTDKKLLKKQFEKQQLNHDRHVPIANCLLRLRTQQLILELSPNSKLALKEAGNDAVPESAPWYFKAIFNLMEDKVVDIAAIHSLIECIALLALYEAWQKPFEVKLVKHEGKWVLRIRFRGTFGKRDLLVRFNVAETMQVFNSIPKKEWKKMRRIVHSVMTGDIEQRELGKDYRKVLNNLIQPNDILTIQRKFLEKTGIKGDHHSIASQPSLAELEISWSQKAKYLLEVGKIVFDHYHFDQVKRRKLCWDVVFKCIEYRGFSQAAEMINLLRGAHEEPSEGYAALFAQVIQKNVDSYLIYQACSPFPTISEEQCMELAQAKDKISIVQKIMNQTDTSAEIFLEIVQLLKIKNPIMGERILCKLIAHDKKNACKLIMERDNLSFNSQEYTTLVNRCILDNVSSFEPIWIKNYIFSKRFFGTEEEKHILCKQLLNKPIVVQDKDAICKLFEIKDSTLWQMVANEYISSGEKWPETYNKDSNIDYESLVLWFNIIGRADDTAFVEETLLKIKTKDSIRGLVLVQLLKNWERRKVDVQILKKLDVSKKPIPWEKVLANAETGADILRNLNNVSLPLYAALFRALKPKEPFYATWWVKMIEETCPGEKLLPALQTPLMTDCLHINPPASLPLYKKVAHTNEGVQIALDTLKEVDENLFYALIKTCVELDDQGAAGARVVLQFYDSKKHRRTAEFTQHLRILLNRIFMNPLGDVDAVLKIKKTLNKDANPDQLPCREQLVQLIRNNNIDWVIEILNKATIQELENLPSEFYCFLINSCKEIDKRCVIIERCPVVSEVIQKKWIEVSQTEKIDIFSAGKLLESAQKLKVPGAKVQECALFVLTNISTNSIEISEKTLKYLLEMTSTIELDKGYKLWEALNKLKRIEKKELFQKAVDLLNRNPLLPHYGLLNWLLNNVSEQTHDQVFSLILNLAQYPLEDRIQKIILKWLKKEVIKNNEEAKELYWKIVGENCDDSTYKEIEKLNPSHEECLPILDRLIKISKNGLLSEAMLNTLHYLSLKQGYFFDKILLSFETDTIKDLLSPRFVFQAHQNPQHIERIQSAINLINDKKKQQYLNTILLSAKVIEKPSKQLALSFIYHVDSLWDDFNSDLWSGEIENWTEMLKDACDAEDKFSSVYTLQELLYVFINNNFIKSKRIYFEPEILNRFLLMISTRSQELPYMEISFLKMLLRSIRKNFNEVEAESVFNYIFGPNCIYREGLNLTKDFHCKSFNLKEICFTVGMLVQTAEIIIENSPIMSKWSRICSTMLHNHIPEALKDSQGFNEGYAAYIALSGKIPLSGDPNNVVKAVQLLSSTKPPENLKMAGKIIERTLSKVDKANFSNCKETLVHGILSVTNDEIFLNLLPNLFSYFIQRINKDKLSNIEIYLILEQIIDARPSLLPKLIDFVNVHILCKLSKFYQEKPDSYIKIIQLIYLHCENARIKGFDHVNQSFENFITLIHTHPYINANNLKEIVKNQNILMQCSVALMHYSGFNLFRESPDELVIAQTVPLTDDYKQFVSPKDDLILKLCIKHLWCQMTTEVMIDEGFELNYRRSLWMDRIIDEFIDSFLLTSQIPDRRAQTLNMLSVFEKVIKQVNKIGKVNPTYANSWFISLIQCIRTKLITAKQSWFMVNILEILGRNMSIELLPSLKDFEKICEEFDYKPVCMEAYISLINNGYRVDEVLQKCLYNTIFLPEYEEVYFACFTNYIEKFKSDQDVENFKKYIMFLSSHLDLRLKRSYESYFDLSKKLINYVNKELQYLKNKEVFQEVMNLLIHLIDINQGNPHAETSEIAEIHVSLLLLAIFYGENNDYLKRLHGKYIEEVSNIDISNMICSDFGKQTLKWIIQIDDKIPFNFDSSIQKRTQIDPTFMEFLRSSMNEVLLELERYKRIRPELSNWFNKWKEKIDGKLMLYASPLNQP